MALQKGSSHSIPSDAVRLTEEEAMLYQYNLLKDWKNTSDTFAFRYGIPLLGTASALTGIYMNRFFRIKYKLRNYASFSTYLPACVLPTAISMFFHFQMVLPDIVLFKNSCPVCVEMKAATCQVFAGGIMPFLLGNLGCMAMATKYYTYNIPDVIKEPLKTLKAVQTLSKPVMNTWIAACIGQALIASAVTYYEGKAVYTVQKKLLEEEDV